MSSSKMNTDDTPSNVLSGSKVITAIIKDEEGNILTIYYEDLNFYTVPVWVVKEGRTPEQELILQMAESLNIVSLEYEKILIKPREFVNPNNSRNTVTQHMYDVRVKRSDVHYNFKLVCCRYSKWVSLKFLMERADISIFTSDYLNLINDRSL